MIDIPEKQREKLEKWIEEMPDFATLDDISVEKEQMYCHEIGKRIPKLSDGGYNLTIRLKFF